MKNISKKILSGILAAGMALSLIPSFGTTAAYAAQSNEYTDPADVWIKANGRTNELDINATTTYETNYCPVCKMQTTFLAYRVPEYTRTGETALNRGVEWSDGTMIDGVNTGNLDSGTPGIDASYTGYHFTKTVCQNCGTINSSNGEGSYSFGKNVYGLNPCDHNFFLPFDNTTYEQHDDHYHIKVEKEGEYCQYCKGTYATAKEKQEHHHLDDTIIAELGNQRFHIIGDCDDCGYIENDYVAAKTVVQSYYGKVDGDAHSIVLSDLSESGVNTSIRYGTEADKCTKTSAPSYTDEGYYPVYYEITYSYDGESMTEDGVSYVWLLSAENSTTTVSSVHTHDFRYLETVKPTCTELGYERWQCSECGALEKRNYTPATGHDYDTVTIREASCTQGGLVLHLCKDCGDFYTETTPTIDHDYEKHIVPATCTKAGYTEYKCKDCGHSYITEITALIPHNYIASVTEPTCTTKGFTTYTCDICGDTYISDYTEPTGHEWDEGHIITVATCDGEGVIEYNCLNCDEKMIKAISAKGHTAGAPATCTEPQICIDCGAILELSTGHHYRERLENNEWLSDTTKGKAINKLDKMGIKIGYPNSWKSCLDNVDIKSSKDGRSYFENVMSILRARKQESIEKQYKSIDKTEWEIYPFEANACYSFTSNDITFPAAILQAPFYDVNASYEQNLGGIGYVIAHEISHAFDADGAKFDENGNASDWWSERDYKEFQMLCEKMVDFYDGCEEFPGIGMNGTLTLSENIADQGAVACITEITSRLENPDFKTLYKSMASCWASASTRGAAEELARTDSHSADKVRINRTVVNCDEFYSAFEIDESNGMYVAPENRVKIW